MSNFTAEQKERIARELGYQSYEDISAVARRNIEAPDTNLEEIGIEVFADRLITECDRAVGAESDR